ncbi:MAG TPA: hypothetical protein DCX07_08390 [Phycisphaerales bacterium]|nr:hypothetical protein [Phycisphaerales bacterium]
MTEPVEKQPRKPRFDRWVKLGFVAVIVIVVAVVYLVQQKAPELEGWSSDLPGALAAAKERQTQVLLVFTNNPPSQEDRSFIEKCLTWRTTRNVLTHLGYERVHLTIADHPSAAQRYQVSNVPAVLLLDSAGTILKQRSGYMSDLAFCNEFLGISVAEIRKLQEQDQTNP